MSKKAQPSSWRSSFFLNSQKIKTHFHESSPPSGDALSASNHEPTLFFLARRLPHVVQGAEGTGFSGCEVHDGRGEESSEGVQLSHGARFLRRCTWTLTTSQSRSRLSTSLSCKKKSTLRPNRPCMKIIYVPDVILALQNEARFKLLAVRASERCRVRHPDPAR